MAMLCRNAVSTAFAYLHAIVGDEVVEFRSHKCGNRRALFTLLCHGILLPDTGVVKYDLER